MPNDDYSWVTINHSNVVPLKILRTTNLNTIGVSTKGMEDWHTSIVEDNITGEVCSLYL